MIRFDVIFGQNQIADCEAACFGWLASVNDLWYRKSKIQTNANKYLATEFTNGARAAEELVWYVAESATSVNRADAWAVVKEIVEEIPWLGDAVFLHPATQTVRIKLGDNPCDKSILCIGIIRNYFMVPSFTAAYKKARERGASVKEAYIFAALLEYSSDWRGEWFVCTRTLWEYDAVNSATFGKAALKAMFSPGYAPWKQGTWREQPGYDREHTLHEDFVGFDGDVEEQKLLDTFSVERDERILVDQEMIGVRDNDGVDDLINQIRQAMQA